MAPSSSMRSTPRLLHRVGQEQAVGGVQGATLGAQVLGSLAGLCRCAITVRPEEGLGQRLHDHDERASLSDAATSEPHGAAVVGRRGHWQQDGGLVRPRVEALLHGENQEGHGVDLLLGACGVGGHFSATAAGPCVAKGKGAHSGSAG